VSALGSASQPTGVAGTASDGTGHVMDDGQLLDQDTVQFARRIDPAFLTEIGWDRSCSVLFLPPEHRLLGRPVCRAAGCGLRGDRTAPRSDLHVLPAEARATRAGRRTGQPAAGA